MNQKVCKIPFLVLIFSWIGSCSQVQFKTEILISSLLGLLNLSFPNVPNTSSTEIGATSIIPVEITSAQNLSPTISFNPSSFVYTQGIPIASATPTLSINATACTATPALPAGLNLNENTCLLSGTPTVTQGATTHTISATTPAGTATTTVSITVNSPPSSAKAITSFGFASPQATGFITGTNIVVTVPFGTNVTGLVANFTTTGTRVTISGVAQTNAVTSNNFSNPVAYVVTAQDSSTVTYIVTVTVASNTARELTSFQFPNSIQTTFSGTNVSVIVPNGTNLSSLVANFTTTGVSVRVGATLQSSGTTTNNFSSPVTYIVTAGNGSTQNYTITVTAALASAKSILSFGFSNPLIQGSISGTNIAVTVPFGTDVTNLVAVFSFTGSSVRVNGNLQTSGTTANNFSSAVSYLVTAADSSTQTFVVTVAIAASINSAIVNGSFQSGSITNVSTTTIATLNNPVDLTKAFVYCGARITSSDANRAPTCQLTGPSTVSIISEAASSGTEVNWFVIEYAFGVTVQRGNASLPSGTGIQNISINTIDQTKTFAIVTSRTNTSSQIQDEQRTIRVHFTSNTNLRLERQVSTSMNVTVEWQVIQMNGANVQSGFSTISNGNLTTTANLNPVNTGKTFLFFSSSGSSVGGFETHLYTRGTVTNSTTLTFTRRGTSQSVQITWFAVEMTDGTTVQRGSTTLAGGAGTSATADIASINTNKSMIIWSNDTAGETDTALQDSATYSARFNSSTQLRFTRNNDENNAATLDWFTVEFQ